MYDHVSLPNQIAWHFHPILVTIDQFEIALWRTSMSSDGDEGLDGDLFREPDDYFEPEKPATYTEHTLLSGQKLSLRLVGHNPLWVLAPIFSISVQWLITPM